MAREEETEPERTREHGSIKEFISNYLPPHKGADLDPWKSQSALCFGSLSLCVRKQAHLTTTTRRINLSCKMPVGHVWRFVGCVCCSRLIGAWRCRRTKHGGDALIWQELDSPTKKTKEEKQMRREAGINKGRRERRGDRKGRRNETQESVMVRAENRKNSSHHMILDKANYRGLGKALVISFVWNAINSKELQTCFVSMLKGFISVSNYLFGLEVKLDILLCTFLLYFILQIAGFSSSPRFN